MENGTKLCRTCGQELPATDEYFTRNSRYASFRPDCKKCRSRKAVQAQQTDPEAYAARMRKRKQLERSATGECSSDAAERIRTRQQDCCYYCGQHLWNKGELDHKVPLSRGGHNSPANRVWACLTCNRDKHDKTAREYLERRRQLGLPIALADFSDEEQDDDWELTEDLRAPRRREPSNRIKLVDKYFETIGAAAEFYGVKEITIQNWLHWLRFLPPAKRKELVREIEIRGLDYANGVVGTEEEEEKREEERKHRITIDDNDFSSTTDAAKHYGVREITIRNWIHWLKHLPTYKQRRKLIKEIRERERDYVEGVIGTEEEEDEKAQLAKERAKAVTEMEKQRQTQRKVAEEARARVQMVQDYERARWQGITVQELRDQREVAEKKKKREVNSIRAEEARLTRRDEKVDLRSEGGRCPMCFQFGGLEMTQEGRRKCKYCGAIRN